MEITEKRLTEAIRNHVMGKSIDPELVALGVTDSWISHLIRVYCLEENASRGASSDCSGGGNPHRIMEEEEYKRAWGWFKDVCNELNLNPWDCLGALRKAGVR